MHKLNAGNMVMQDYMFRVHTGLFHLLAVVAVNDFFIIWK